jgi:hypothetical protein
MYLTAPDYDAVLYVVRNMRAADKEEIYALRWHESPEAVAGEVMARPEMTWVAYHDGVPTAVLGGVEVNPGVWRIHCFGTDYWSKIAISLTRFVKKKMLPLLFDEFKARRLEADSHWSHMEAHRWMEICGAEREGVRRALGKDGSDYVTYTLLDKGRTQV